MAISVYIRPDEYATALDAAVRRISDSLMNKSRDGLSNKGWIEGTVKHIQGAVAEVAVAKALDRYPQLGVRQYSGMAADVSREIEVRYSSSDSLVIRPNDPDDRLYVLCTGEVPNLVVEGWISKQDGISCGEWKDVGNRGRPAWFVPKDKLLDIDKLKSPNVPRLATETPNLGG